ncbi:uncharacterized protein A4U43_C07F16070 [Asparagus officinalis]|uniref:C2H2-type domain-containing protein n=1 Tax=Asparagus officinalis TaxID=4686 RepID=A0A5P1EHI3_ASPOF|nr:uncharacterized protein A4U43_C07F16070 [Asparagus officinalis]
MTPQNSTANDLPCTCCKRKFSTHQALGAHQKAHEIKQIILQKKQPWSRARRSHVGLCTSCMGGSAFGRQVTSAIEQAYLMRLRQLAVLRRKNHSEEPGNDDAAVAGVGWFSVIIIIIGAEGTRFPTIVLLNYFSFFHEVLYIS